MHNIENKGAKKKLSAVDMLSSMGVYAIFAVIIVIFAVGNSRFLTGGNLLLILQQAAPMGIVAVGMTFVMVTGGIDISVGRNMFLVSACIAYFVNNIASNPEVSCGGVGMFLLFLLFATVVGGLIGLMNGLIVTKLKILPFIVTLATGSIIRGFGLILTGSGTPSLAVISKICNGSVFGIPIVTIVFAVILVIFHIVLKRTRYGRHIMAIGNSPEAAKKAGINVDRCIIGTYIICGALGAFGGLFSAGQGGGVPLSFGEGNEFIAISATVIGGTSLFGGKAKIIPGAIVGILLITTIMNGLAMMNASPYIYTVVRGAIIFVSVMMDSIKFKGNAR